MAFFDLLYWSTHSCFFVINHSLASYYRLDYSRHYCGRKLFCLLRLLVKGEYFLLLLAGHVKDYHVLCRTLADRLHFHSQWDRRLITSGWLLDSGKNCFEACIFFDGLGDSRVGEKHCGIKWSRSRVLKSWLWDWIDSNDLRGHTFFVNEADHL